MNIGKVGIWTGQLDSQPAAKAKEAAWLLEQLGIRRSGSQSRAGRRTRRLTFSHACSPVAGRRNVDS
jgi:hypothetical protein